MERREWQELREKYESASMSEAQQQKMKLEITRAKMENRRRQRIGLAAKGIAAAAAVLVILPNTSANVAYAMSGMPVIGRLVEAVTFRNYQYQSEQYIADVEVPKLHIKESETDEAGTDSAQQTDTLQKTTEQINQEIEHITQQIIDEFEEDKKEELGHQDILVKHEAISTTDRYYTLKLICYQGEGSGAEWDYFYTIDLQTGERIVLKDLFRQGADYITPISANIKEQMREQMAADENVMYWLDDEDMPEWNFKEITEETSFYINQDNDLVIAFNEGDVAPMYMGCVEFVIPGKVLEDIRK